MALSIPPGDRQVRAALEKWLLAEHAREPGTALLSEVGVCRGQVRVDLLLVNGALHGYEIKSDRDNLRRLGSQIEFYSKVLDRATLVVGERYLEEAGALLPDWWGILQIELNGPKISFSVSRSARPNPEPDPRAITEFLWRDEALALLEERGAARGVRGKPRRVLWDRICEALSVDEIAAAAREHLRSRTALPALP